MLKNPPQRSFQLLLLSRVHYVIHVFVYFSFTRSQGDEQSRQQRPRRNQAYLELEGGCVLVDLAEAETSSDPSECCLRTMLIVSSTSIWPSCWSACRHIYTSFRVGRWDEDETSSAHARWRNSAKERGTMTNLDVGL